MRSERVHMVGEPRHPSLHHAPSGRGETVFPAFWCAVAALLAALLLRAPLGQSTATLAATLIFLAGGLPHGAYDIALLSRATTLRRSGLIVATGCYVAMAAAMAILWMTLPLLALVVFLAVATVHFSEDWDMVSEPLLRLAAGAAVIAAPLIGSRAEVTRLFVAMSDERATVVAQSISAAAPVILLLTIVSVVAAWQAGSRQWAAAMAVCLALLVLAPPVAGFALFFVFLHSPRHLRQARAALPTMSRAKWLATGGLLSGAAVLGWWLLAAVTPAHFGEDMTAEAFKLLASVALPHLLLSRRLEHLLTRHASSGPEFRSRPRMG